mmetsp:Transcript_61325/g.146035  ORF Transcript_61325/g.146035 Transcript_61325/m.146035 type:complete len:674 (-) Transcript_61325:114-2135(-)
MVLKKLMSHGLGLLATVFTPMVLCMAGLESSQKSLKDGLDRTTRYVEKHATDVLSMLCTPAEQDVMPYFQQPECVQEGSQAFGKLVLINQTSLPRRDTPLLLVVQQEGSDSPDTTRQWFSSTPFGAFLGGDVVSSSCVMVDFSLTFGVQGDDTFHVVELMPSELGNFWRQKTMPNRVFLTYSCQQEQCPVACSIDKLNASGAWNWSTPEALECTADEGSTDAVSDTQVVKELHQKVLRLTSELNAAEAAVVEVQSRNTDLQSQLQNAHANITQTAELMSTVISENTDLKSQVQIANESMTNTAEVIGKVNSKNSGLESQLKMANHNITQTAEVIRKLEAQIADLRLQASATNATHATAARTFVEGPSQVTSEHDGIRSEHHDDKVQVSHFASKSATEAVVDDEYSSSLCEEAAVIEELLHQATNRGARLRSMRELEDLASNAKGQDVSCIVQILQTKYYSHSDPKSTAEGLAVLSRIGSPNNDSLLQIFKQMIVHAEWEVRQAALKGAATLFGSRNDTGLKEIFQRAVNDKVVAVQVSAVEALAIINTPGPLPDEMVRAFAGVARRFKGQREPHPGKTVEAAITALATLGKQCDRYTVMTLEEFAEEIGYSASSVASNGLIRLLSTSDCSDLRKKAIQTLEGVCRQPWLGYLSKKAHVEAACQAARKLREWSV